MRHAGFVLLVLALAALEAVLPRLVPVDAARPLLLVPLVLYFALRLNTLEGALLSFLAGFAMDVNAGLPTGLATFGAMSLFVGARLVLAAMRADGGVFEALFTFALVAAYHGLTGAASRLFGPPAAAFGDTPWVSALLLSALATSLATPFVMAAARRIDKLRARSAEIL